MGSKVKMKQHPNDRIIETYRGFPIGKTKNPKYDFCKFETKHQLHVQANTIKNVKNAIDRILKNNNRRFE